MKNYRVYWRDPGASIEHDGYTNASNFGSDERSARAFYDEISKGAEHASLTINGGTILQKHKATIKKETA